jgi:hypothetical protein
MPPRRSPVLVKETPEPDYAWDRQPNESPKAFEAFAVYRDMGYQRSLAAPRRGRCQSRVRSGGIPAASWSATVFAMIRAVS